MNMDNGKLPSISPVVSDEFFSKVCNAIDSGLVHVATAVNTAMVYSYYSVGRYIVEDEQKGEHRAAYGKAVLKTLSERLVAKYGPGWSEETLKKVRKFYKVYSLPNSVHSVDRIVSSPEKVYTVDQINAVGHRKAKIGFTLSWSHYLILMRIDNPDERSFYEIECAAQNWSVRQLQRQVTSSLYERLALSRDKNGVMELARKGQTLETPSDIIKNPLSLEFLGLRQLPCYSENRLECAIIDRLEKFLLELGKGFLFESRQKRFTFNEKHFFVDLVFYNRLLRCYVLIDLKIEEISHQDLGQMQMYVNYFDRCVKLPDENPTIGILLCGKKDDELVNLTLPANANIFAQEYSLYLPNKKLLQAKLREWVAENENQEQHEVRTDAEMDSKNSFPEDKR